MCPDRTTIAMACCIGFALRPSLASARWFDSDLALTAGKGSKRGINKS